jgi:hypothetical protein
LLDLLINLLGGGGGDEVDGSGGDGFDYEEIMTYSCQEYRIAYR